MSYGKRMELKLFALVVATTVGGCSAGDAASSADTEDFIDVDIPPSDCSPQSNPSNCPASSGSGGSSEGGPCRDSDNCLDGTMCIASFEDGVVGEFSCTTQCITLNNPDTWCVDNLACCEPQAQCSARGLCVLAPDTGSSTGQTDDGGPTTGSTDDSGSDTETGTTTDVMDRR